MAKTASKSKAPKLTRAEKREARATKRAARKANFAQMREVFTLTRKADARLIPYMVLAFAVAVTVVFLVALLATSSWILGLIFSLPFGALAAFALFGRRAQRSIYEQASGQPGAAGWLLQNQLRGDWRTEPTVAGNAQLDAVHRLIGRPGIVLVGEGAPQRVKGLVAQEKKRIARLSGETPIYDVIVGDGEGQVPLRKLQMHLRKLPPNLSRDQVSTLDRRLQAITSGRTPLPQGPVPTNVKMRNVQRAARRKS
jgi:hypothetical protein